MILHKSNHTTTSYNIAAILNWNIQHINIKTAFLYGVLSESKTVFIEQPPGFEFLEKEVWVM